MGRTKGSKNKPKVKELAIGKFRDTKLHRVTDIDKYEMRRSLWYFLALEKKILVDPTSVTPQQFEVALKNYTDKMRAYKQRLKDEKAQSRMDKKKTQRSSTRPGGSAGIGQDGQVDLGARVSTDNPIT